MLYDNDNEHKGSNADSEENLHCKHLVLQYTVLYTYYALWTLLSLTQ